MNNIISIDESSIDSHISHNKGWSKFGSKVTKTITHTRVRYSLILSISNKKILHYQLVKGSVNGEMFFIFIKDLIKKLTQGTQYHVVLDNAKIHHYRKIKEYIETKPNIELIYNIPYTPETKSN